MTLAPDLPNGTDTAFFREANSPKGQWTRNKIHPLRDPFSHRLITSIVSIQRREKRKKKKKEKKRKEKKKEKKRRRRRRKSNTITVM